MSHILETKSVQFTDYREVFIYYVVDEYLKNCDHHIETKPSASNSCPKLSDAEIIFTFIMAFSSYGGNYARAMSSLYNAKYIKNILSKGQFSTRIYKLYPIIFEIYTLFGTISKEINKKYALDTFPVALCHNIRIKRSKLIKGKEYRGYNSSKKEYFYGFKIHLITAMDGTVTEFEFSPGAVGDIDGYNLLNFDLPPGSELFMDKAYNFYQREDELSEIAQIMPKVIRKINSKKADNTYEANKIKQEDRRHIETDISLIVRLFPKKIHVTNVAGFFLKILGFILAYNINIYFDQTIEM
jgi:hypothetical protein